MAGQSRVGLGITTYNRPDYFRKSVESAIQANPDKLVAFNDGSTKDYSGVYKEIEGKCEVIDEGVNGGVAKAKNRLLTRLLELGCDHIFLMEDDIIIKSPGVFEAYIDGSSKSGLQHLSFAHHGEANAEGYKYSDGIVDYYPHAVGAFCYYSRESLEVAGLMDENFHNAWEHVEHTKRLGDMGYTSPFGAFADISNSREFLEEIPGSIENSSIWFSDDRRKRMLEGLEYWRSIDPDCPVEIGESL